MLNLSHTSRQQGELDVSAGTDGSVKLQFRGALTIEHLPQLWDAALQRVRSSQSRLFIIDLAAVTFTGELLFALVTSLFNPRSIRFRELFLAAENAGVNALPTILLLGLLIGMIVAFLAASVLQPFGAVSMIPMVVSIGMVREFAPLITAIFLSGRCGSFYAAEIGTMKVTEELDALESFGLNRMRFLVVPRVLASMITTPMLTVFFMFSGLVGGYAVCRVFGIGLQPYLGSVGENVDYTDFLGALAKSVIFALLVSSVGCLRGFQTGRGPGSVGISTTRSLVTAVALVIFADGVLGAVYYFLGI